MWRFLALLFFVAPALTQAGGYCQQKNPEPFAKFLAVFSNDPEFVRQRTRYPLTQVLWEYGLDAKGRDVSASKRTIVPKPELEPKPSQSLTEIGFRTQILNQSSYRASVRVFVENSDWEMNYHFRRFGMCWWLVKTEDFSL